MDFGLAQGSSWTATGKRGVGRTFFAIVLSHSRKGYSEVVLRQIYRCVFDVPGECLLALRAECQARGTFDNLGKRSGAARGLVRSRVASEDAGVFWSTTAACFCRPSRGRRGIRGRSSVASITFRTNYAQGPHLCTNLQRSGMEHLSRWEAEIADVRACMARRGGAPGQHFLAVEKGGVVAVARKRKRLASFSWSAARRVHRDGHVEVEKAYYSVPPEYVGQTVWARWDGRVVRVLNDRLVSIALHAQQLPGKFSTHHQHIVTEKINAVEHGAEYLLAKVRRLGVGCARWAEAMLQRPPSSARSKHWTSSIGISIQRSPKSRSSSWRHATSSATAATFCSWVRPASAKVFWRTLLRAQPARSLTHPSGVSTFCIIVDSAVWMDRCLHPVPARQSLLQTGIRCTCRSSNAHPYSRLPKSVLADAAPS